MKDSRLVDHPTGVISTDLYPSITVCSGSTGRRPASHGEIRMLENRRMKKTALEARILQTEYVLFFADIRATRIGTLVVPVSCQPIIGLLCGRCNSFADIIEARAHRIPETQFRRQRNDIDKPNRKRECALYHCRYAVEQGLRSAEVRGPADSIRTGS